MRTRWIEELPDLVASLAHDWGIEIGAQFDEGTEALVAEAVMADGTPAILKVLVPRSTGIADHEATVLRIAAGIGCPLLYRDDPDRGALLMERLGPSLFRLGLPYEQRLPILCDAASKIWRPASDSGLPTGAEKAAWLQDYIAQTWTELDEPCSERRSSMPSPVRSADSTPTTTSGRCSCTVTCSSGTRCRPATASSWSTPTVCSPNPSTTSE